MNKKIIDYPFMRYPRALIESPIFSDISIEARTMLAMILDRFELSTINSDKFTDRNGIYVIFTVEEVCRKLGCSKTRAQRIFTELENYDMITRKRKNRMSPYRIYLNGTFYDSINRALTTAQNVTSREHVLSPRESTKCAPINNNINNNNYINNNPSITGFERTEEEIKEQIEYDCLACDSNRKILDEIVMIISDVFSGTSETVRIGKDVLPRGYVISRFCRLNGDHVFDLLITLQNNTVKIKNIKQYLITALFNAPVTAECETEAEFAYNLKSS